MSHALASSPSFISLAEGAGATKAYVLRSAEPLRGRYPDLDWERARVSYVDAGIMNYVYQVDVDGRRFFLKQALDRVKQHDRLGPDLAGVSPARITVEARALGILRSTLPPSFRDRVPAVAWHDTGNRTLWTEDVCPGAAPLQASLAAGRCDPAIAEDVGRLLGAIHAVPLAASETLWPSTEEDRGNWERFLRMRTVGVLPRAALPSEVEGVIRDLARQARRHERPGMISHLDAAPKNVLVHPDGEVALLDFELGAAVSDPAYDVGFLAGHYLLMGAVQPAIAQASLQAVEALIRGYCQTAAARDAGWEGRVRQYAGATLLYRLYGTSPAAYISPDSVERVRQEGIRLLLDAAV